MKRPAAHTLDAGKTTKTAKTRAFVSTANDSPGKAATSKATKAASSKATRPRKDAKAEDGPRALLATPQKPAAAVEPPLETPPKEMKMTTKNVYSRAYHGAVKRALANGMDKVSAAFHAQEVARDARDKFLEFQT